MKMTRSEGTWLCNEPGEYRLVFPAIDGFAQLVPLTVEVAYGEILDVRVELKR